MADLQRRPSRTPRRQRQQRAYQLAVTGGATGTAGVVALVLAFAGVIGYGLPVVLLIVAALALVGFRRTVSGR